MPRFPFFPSPKKKADTAAIAEQKAADEKAAQEDAATKVASATDVKRRHLVSKPP